LVSIDDVLSHPSRCFSFRTMIRCVVHRVTSDIYILLHGKRATREANKRRAAERHTYMHWQCI